MCLFFARRNLSPQSRINVSHYNACPGLYNAPFYSFSTFQFVLPFPRCDLLNELWLHYFFEIPMVWWYVIFFLLEFRRINHEISELFYYNLPLISLVKILSYRCFCFDCYCTGLYYSKWRYCTIAYLWSVSSGYKKKTYKNIRVKQLETILFFLFFFWAKIVPR